MNRGKTSKAEQSKQDSRLMDSSHENEWSEAYERLALYLESHGVKDKIDQAHLILPVLKKAKEAYEMEHEIHPFTHVFQAAHEMMEAWFNTILSQSQADTPSSPSLSPNFNSNDLLLQGRGALFLSDADKKWPVFLFQPEALKNNDLTNTLRSSLPQARPDLEFSSMAARPIDLGSWSHAAGNAFKILERQKLLKLTLIWVIVTLILTFIFWITR